MVEPVESGDDGNRQIAHRVAGEFDHRFIVRQLAKIAVQYRRLRARFGEQPAIRPAAPSADSAQLPAACGCRPGPCRRRLPTRSACRPDRSISRCRPRRDIACPVSRYQPAAHAAHPASPELFRMAQARQLMNLSIQRRDNFAGSARGARLLLEIAQGTAVDFRTKICRKATVACAKALRAEEVAAALSTSLRAKRSNPWLSMRGQGLLRRYASSREELRVSSQQ